jgi:hypothetical protein
MLQELNKLAIIHLFLLGFEDDLDNFTLTLNNPSTQAEMLKVEHMQVKVSLVKDSVSDIGNGFGVMSWTRAHRDILGWSDDEIKQDLLEQRMEKAASAELQNTSAVIKHTGMFDAVDKIYGDYQAALKGAQGGDEAGAEGGGGGGSFGGGGGGGFGGGGLGGEDLDFGAEAGGEDAEAGGDLDFGAEAGAEEPAAGAETTPDAGTTPETPEALSESLNKTQKLLSEQKIKLENQLKVRAEKYQKRFVDVLVESVKKNDKEHDVRVKIYDKNVKINEDVNNMINDINKMLDE